MGKELKIIPHRLIKPIITTFGETIRVKKCVWSFFSFLALYFCLWGCSFSPPSQINPITVSTPKWSATPISIKPTSSPMIPIPTNTIAPTLAEATVTNVPTILRDQVVMQFKPLQIISQLPDDAIPSDDLFFFGDPPFILHFTPSTQQELLSNNDYLSPSPDGKWIAFSPLVKSSADRRWLIVTFFDGKQQKKIAIDPNLIWFGSYEWLNNNHLILPKMSKNQPRPYPMVVIDPFSGEQTEISSDYSELHLFYSGSAPMVFNYSDVVYDPSLNFVVFQHWEGTNYYEVWNRQKNVLLAKVEDPGLLGLYPLWSPNGERVAIVVQSKSGNQKDHYTDDWISVSREGQAKWITHFSDYFTLARIGSANWSPDGQKLVFWVETIPSECSSHSGQQLAVLDLPAKQVTNYCIAGSEHGDAAPPVWSLDNEYIAVKNSEGLYLVNLDQGWASHIPGINHGTPGGWLLRNP